MNRICIISVLIAALIFTSCDQDELREEFSADVEAIQAEGYIEYSVESDFTLAADLDNDYDATIQTLSLEKNQCVQVTTTGTRGSFPITYTLDFGTGCTSPRGITRTGILEFTYTGRLFSAGSVLTIERQNYTINGRALAGTITYTNNGGSVPDWTRTVSNGSLTTLAGTVFTFSGTRSIRTAQGSGNGTLADNVYEIYAGNRTVVRPNGTSMTITVNTTLVKPHNCANIVSGSIDLNGTRVDGILDYGNGTCDNQAEFTHVNGNTRTITLR
jgi:hypothetical protein